MVRLGAVFMVTAGTLAGGALGFYLQARYAAAAEVRHLAKRRGVCGGRYGSPMPPANCRVVVCVVCDELAGAAELAC